MSCRAVNALTARLESFAARKAHVFKRAVFNLAAYIDNNGNLTSGYWKSLATPSALKNLSRSRCTAVFSMTISHIFYAWCITKIINLEISCNKILYCTVYR